MPHIVHINLDYNKLKDVGFLEGMKEVKYLSMNSNLVKKINN